MIMDLDVNLIKLLYFVIQRDEQLPIWGDHKHRVHLMDKMV